MAKDLSGKNASAPQLFQHRNTMLKTIREHSLGDLQEQSQSFIFQQCCIAFKEAFACSAVWAGNIDPDQHRIILLASSPSQPPPDRTLQQSIADSIHARFGQNLTTFTKPFHHNLEGQESHSQISSEHNCLIWPVLYQNQFYGFVVMQCPHAIELSELRQDFINHVITDITFAVFSLDTALKLQDERDFNKDIVDTIQALMVTISPCGTIVSFNRRAEKVTGYTKKEIEGKYWVDVLINPEKILEFQQLFAETLKGTQTSINFKAPLRTKSGGERFIRWHGSIRHNIEKGKVGLVMIGIDETETLMADQQLNMFTARWEKIFIAIQDPALVVANDNTILEANPATCAAAKKRRDEVIGKKVCDILHGGHGRNSQCPLEQFIGCHKTQITETELFGLHGTYMLTVSPLVEEDGESNATLLVARNLTEEEVVRAEAIRVAQLAAIGELASGIAHEINNPINGIINYAQIILDDPNDLDMTENLANILSEGKRIAGIVKNLLNFARYREDVLNLAQLENIIANSLHLVAHLLKKDGIICSVNIPAPLPPLMCNEQQLQQVILNVISNSRYALNKKFPQACPEKQLEIKGGIYERDKTNFIRLTFTDHGTGIPPEILNRLFDPFFSTKPKGEGTGLGLSISHGLVREHGGAIRVQSKVGEWTRLTIDLPVRSQGEK